MYITDDNANMALDMLNGEMGKILSTGDMSKDKLCLIGEIVDIMKDIKEIDGEDMEGGMYKGNSNRGYSQRYNSYNGGYSYRRGMSMDSERDRIMSKMEQFMNQASNESKRQLVRRIMDSI